MHHRNVLFITSRFPPVASVGAVRVRKFCRYLPANGWQPVVITGPLESIGGTNESVSAARDVQSLDNLPAGIEIVRLPADLQRWPQPATERWSRRFGRLTGWVGVDASRWMAGLGWRVEATWRALSFPDVGIWQRRAALAAASELHRRHRFEAIFSSAMPFSDHLIALEIQRRLRIPWIADFRDPWIGYVHSDTPMSQLQRLRACRAEARIVNAAARVVSIGELMTARFRERYPHLAASKFATVRNGFDPADQPPPSKSTPSNTLRLLYTGSFYAGRGPLTLFSALRALRRHGIDVRLALAGRAGPFADAIREASAEGLATWHGLVPHHESMRLMSECDVLVVLQDDRPGTEIDLSAKTYEYLGSGKPILALVGADGEADRLLGRFDGVWRCPPFDESAVLNSMHDIVHRWRTGQLRASRPADDLAMLTRPYQARQLAQLLDDVTQTRPRPPRPARASRQVRDLRNVEALTILAYHRVSDEASPLTDGRSLTHSIGDFEKQMAYLADRFEPMRLSEAIAALKLGKPLRRALVVTFDDGYAESLQIAAPILRRFGIPATLCITTAVVDNGDLLWRDKLNWLLMSGHAVAVCDAINAAYRKRGIETQPGESVLDLARRHYLHEVIHPLLDELMIRAGTSAADLARKLRPYVTRDALRSADPDWIEIANHSHTHPVLAALEPATQRNELETASEILTSIMGRMPEAVAIPFGIKAAYSPETIDLIRETGHAAALDLRRRPNRAGVSPLELSRIPAPIGDIAALIRAIDRREARPKHPKRSLINA